LDQSSRVEVYTFRDQDKRPKRFKMTVHHMLQSFRAPLSEAVEISTKPSGSESE